ncbi:MAG: ParB N-terminal domain-containing protein [Actinobacteria bacterium]|nr:ParB N-terminal domain-containing protein [Actinomycetota bacterium]
MDIQKLKISQIKQAKYNPRLDLQPGDVEYEKIKRSILEFDLVEPLVWNKQTGNLVGGHQRLKVLQELGKNEVEVAIVDLPQSREKALNVALNKVQGGWDFTKLKDLLQEIDTGEFDIGITGFDENEIEELLISLHIDSVKNDNFDVEKELANIEKPETKIGVLFFRIQHHLAAGPVLDYILLVLFVIFLIFAS